MCCIPVTFIENNYPHLSKIKYQNLPLDNPNIRPYHIQ